ncbi:spore germination protein [Peribacillus simplex]|uniref:Spore germination protein n=2 Tax=Peribacillus simplex TaxID=1478 RepID=A0A9X8ZCH1_9BACI|nr:spore germination protein [Peribacillus simplex]TKH03727.1 spore germination protein [Peribacillus simplex]
MVKNQDFCIETMEVGTLSKTDVSLLYIKGVVDGTPYATIVPGLFFSSFQSPDEYHTKGGRLTIRLLRFGAFILSVYLPAVYVVLDKFEVDNLPKNMAKILFEGSQLLPSFWSMVILILLFTLLIDITFRIPTSTIILVSLVATTVIGETAVSAKIIHPVVLITIGITFLGHFIIANKLMTAHLISYVIYFCGWDTSSGLME